MKCQRTVWLKPVWRGFFTDAYFLSTPCYLSVDFPRIENHNAVGSSVVNIPLIALFSVATFASGRATTETGMAVPHLAATSTVAMMHVGLLYITDIEASKGRVDARNRRHLMLDTCLV